MTQVSRLSLVLSIIAGILSFAWAFVHIPLYNISFLPFGIRVFFLADGVLAIIAGILFILLFRLVTLKIIYIIEIVYWWINYLLLTLTRILPAPIIGRPLPVTTGPALIAFILDILLIIMSTLIYIIQ
ncbi:hypothetical protein BFU36_08770 [Sulfolobus sp. A20]|uniref:hypothetical protein n=1 Tax=Saccharolobus sp. A20 TaxID=1891280 RepID=UPI000845F2B0|nr:hypothetical protein [Sulfolobus sp. A20]TRM75090.1 hypothetical protein DJ532_11085 [Sulfolobus sp. A20-N-F8]TRM79633.1 hypothetical protein DJ528_00085 [Sulfolobus sp. B5]TRM81549.1 hypothetical protein DJ524_03655 [Sulfolobus sp. D5]TRM83397.1 hypothetical protein DJ531_05640 [Sulfolobus sp. A20-N-F6]TRM85356.1 hypothetical protein DJ522_01035 [Sulfolobus sp. F3]TRM89058.1 hypothetical protein DJ521_00685 [Sulfolobus sp. E3]TRM89362.1 hypothetical protein DJ529_02500 [Sulfolobus sp. C3